MAEQLVNRIPEWADEKLSRELPILRSLGEGQELEYIGAFPENTRELAKEIAAFATSNAGTILIGVSNSGDLVGLPSCETVEGRDLILRRLEGIARGTVKPSITPTAKFAVEGNAVVLVLTVPKGSQPVYYCSNTPYLRHLTEARPADPHEVIDYVAKYLQRFGATPTDLESEEKVALYSDLARNLTEVLLFGEQADERQVNPWLDIWRSAYGYAASELRELAARRVAIDEGIDSEIKELADALDKVANMRLHLGSAEEFDRATAAATNLARNIMERYVYPKSLNEASLNQVRDVIVKTSKRLQDLASRVDEMVNSGRIEELQAEASELGYEILRLSYYNIEPLGEGIREDLKRVGRLLHLTETIRIYMDGGISLRALIDRVVSCNENLSSIAAKLRGG